MASTAPPTQFDVLDQLFQGLKNKSSDVRAQSALELQRYVRSYADILASSNPSQISNTIPELSSDTAAKLWEEIINKIFDLVHSQTASEKLGGILAIGACMTTYTLSL